jgi:hypothetical protein
VLAAYAGNAQRGQRDDTKTRLDDDSKVETR